MKKIVLVLLAMVMLIAGPCLAFDGYQGHEGQIPLCQNNKTGVLRVAPMKDIDPTANVDYEPYCNTRFFYGTTTPTETLIWVNIQGIQGIQGPQGFQGEKGDTGATGPQGPIGFTGMQGIQGIKGDKGDKGDQGIQGLQGTQGEKGDKGDQGIQGPQGPAGSDASCVKLTGDTMTGTLNAPSLIVPQISTSFPGADLSISAANGTGNGGAINITGGTAGTSSGGGGGDINITAGWNMPIGGMGWSGLGPPGGVNILAGGGYNTAGGNITIQSGPTSDWASPSNSFSKITIQGGTMDGVDTGGSIEVEGGHNANTGTPYNALGGNVLLIGGDASGSYPGGSVILAGGTGSPGGGVIINTNSTQPPCNSSIRGMLWFIQGAINIKDSFEICAKDASNNYTWRVLW